MEHQFFKDRLSAYFDNELKHEEHAIVHQHIEGCDECQAELKQLEKLENLFAEKSELSDNDYWETSAQKIESALDSSTPTEIVEVTKPKSNGLWWKLTGVAASLVLVAIFAFEQNEKPDELLLEDSYQESTAIIEDTSGENIGLTKVDSLSTFHKEYFKKIENDTLVKLTEEETHIVNSPEILISEDIINTVKTKDTEQKIPFDEYLAKTPPAPIIDDKESGERVEPIKDDIQKTAVDNLTASKTREKKKAESNSLGRTETTKEIESDTKLAQDLDESITVQKIQTSPSAVVTSLLPDSEELVTDGIVVPQKSVMQKSADSNIEIKYWRRKVTENSELLKERSKKSIQYSKSATKKKSARMKSKRPLDIEFTYKQIFEAYYHIAILTNDSLEEKKAVEFLTKYADSLTGSYSSNALHYLQLYKLDKTQRETREKK